MASISPEIVLRWEDYQPAHLPLLKRLAPDRVVSDTSAAALAAAGFSVAGLAQLGKVVEEGLWPGIRRPGNRVSWEMEVSSASSEPWVDSNGYLVSYYQALTGSANVTLAYRPNAKAGLREDVETPFHTVELALVEARVAGGNFLIELPERFRNALLAGDAKAKAALSRLADTTAWFRKHADLFGNEPYPIITALVEAGGQSREIANLLHRRGASPRLWHAAQPLAAGHKPVALVAAGLKQVPPDCFRLAEEGCTLVVDQPVREGLRLLRQEADRTFFTLGNGMVVVYKRRIADPSEFALDVIDLITHKRRATRIWNAQAAIPIANRGPVPGEAILHIINYGGSAREEVQAHIQGHYSKATLLCPELPPRALKAARRGPCTEVFVPTLERLATVRFSN